MLSSVMVGLMVFVDMTTSSFRSQCCFFDMWKRSRKKTPLSTMLSAHLSELETDTDAERIAPIFRRTGDEDRLQVWGAGVRRASHGISGYGSAWRTRRCGGEEA